MLYHYCVTYLYPFNWSTYIFAHDQTPARVTSFIRPCNGCEVDSTCALHIDPTTEAPYPRKLFAPFGLVCVDLTCRQASSAFTYLQGHFIWRTARWHATHASLLISSILAHKLYRSPRDRVFLPDHAVWGVPRPSQLHPSAPQG